MLRSSVWFRDLGALESPIEFRNGGMIDSMIRAVLFDMDGLMFDTERISTKAWIHVGQIHKLPITEEFLSRLRGRPLKQCISLFEQQLGTNVDFWELRKERNLYVENFLHTFGLPVKPGLKELLAYLKSHGYGICLATSTYKEHALRYLRIAGVEQFFDHSVFGNMIENGKPAPDIYLYAAQRLHLSPSQCLVLEDSPCGVEAGWAAGCPVFMIPDLTLPQPEDRRRAKLCLQSLYDVIAFFEKKPFHTV